jgi:hypothetical protein
MNHRAFISYSSRDKSLVDDLEVILRRMGLDIWRDINNIKATQDIKRSIDRAITRNVDVIIVALTNNALAAPWVEYEKQKAADAIASGAALDIVYVNLHKDTYIPGEIYDKLFVDLSSTKKSAKYQENILRLAQYFVLRNPFKSQGIYNIYTDFRDLNSRREDRFGDEGCSIDGFIECANERVIAVGLWFGVLFGPNSANSLKKFLKDNKDGHVELFAPDPDEAPMAQLNKIHEYGGADAVEHRIRTFMNLFIKWGAARGLSESEAKRCKLSLLDFIPVNSFLCVDFGKPTCRIILDIFAIGIEPNRQMKVELRYPGTPLFKMYAESLKSTMFGERITKTLHTSFYS